MIQLYGAEKAVQRLRIAAYCRVSTEKDEQLDSLGNQKEFFREYAEKNGYSLVRLYADEGISGTSLRKREAFKALLRDAEEGAFDMVVAKDVSRFARNTVDFLQSIRTLKSLGINTLFLTANMETLGESEFVLTLYSALAQEESINLSRRVKFGKKLNAKKGRVPSLIYGYRRIDNYTLEIEPAEAAAVRIIYRMYQREGLGCRKISQRLNEEGIPTKLGCQWDPKGVRRILTNPLYCGHFVNNKYEIEDVLEGRQKRLPQEENFHHSRPEWAIVSEEEFRSVQKTLEARSQRSVSLAFPPHQRFSGRHAFSGLIRCADCGYAFRRVTGRKPSEQEPYWICSSYDGSTAASCDNRTRIREKELLQQLRTYFCEAAGDPDAILRECLSLAENHRSRPAEPALIASSADRLSKKLARYQELFAEGYLTVSELGEKTERIKKQLALLRSLAAEQESKSPPEAELRREALRLLNLEDVTNAELRALIERITVDGTGLATVCFRRFSSPFRGLFPD